MIQSRRLRLVALLFAFVMVAAACGNDNKVGKDVDLSFEDQVNQGLDATTTTAAPATTLPGEAPAQGAIGRETTTTAPAVTTTTVAAAKFFEVAILGDKQGTTQFDPSVAVVKPGTLVRFTNRDAKARSVIADGGQFDSGMLQPGANFVWKATGSGRINYSDGTRPYAVGAIEIQ